MGLVVAELRRGKKEGWLWPYTAGLVLGTLIACAVLALLVPT
jgi:hypothetical protein